MASRLSIDVDKFDIYEEQQQNEVVDAKPNPIIQKLRNFFTSSEFKKSCRPTVAVMISCLFVLVK